MKQLALWNIKYNKGEYLNLTITDSAMDASNEYWNKIDEDRFDFFCYVSTILEDKSLGD